MNSNRSRSQFGITFLVVNINYLAIHITLIKNEGV